MNEEELEELLKDLYSNVDREVTHADCDDFLEQEPNVEAKKFYILLKDLDQLIYQNSKASKFSSLIKLLHIKCMSHWSNESFTMLVKMLNDDLWISYTQIDACTSDYNLY